jgi:hypothetical protein
MKIKEEKDSDYKPYKFTDGKISWEEPYRFPATADKAGQYRPCCINIGCKNPVGYTSTSKTGLRVLRTVCNPCHVAGYKKTKLPEGITQHKKTYCENIDGHLGFKCTSIIHFPGVLELDHIDGNHYHNLPENVETLCKICHAYKSHLNGDCR